MRLPTPAAGTTAQNFIKSVISYDFKVGRFFPTKVRLNVQPTMLYGYTKTKDAKLKVFYNFNFAS
jgi:hypothetical protein